MSEPREAEKGARARRGAPPPIADLAAEAERGRTARIPFIALAGVWLAVAVVVAVVLAVALSLYFVYR